MDTPARDLSGGEKARLLLGLATFAGANLLILDEPTNHLDIDSREALVQALAEFSGAVILISHDRHLLEASVDRLWLVADGSVKPFDGDVDAYRRLVLSSRSSEGDSGTSQPRAKAVSEPRRNASERRSQTAPIRKKIKEVEALVEKLQKEIQVIDAKLGDSSLYSRNPTEAAFLAKSRSETAKKLAAAEDSWLAATSELEAVAAE
jgi:ATP-binding cassette subfamily F protein 3